MTETHSAEAIHHAYRELHRAIRAKDRHELEEIHDPEFQGAELPGTLISAEEHITTAINGVDLEIVTYDIAVDIYGDVAVSWGAQTLQGDLDPYDPGTSPKMAAEVRDGLWFSYLLLWRFIDGRWRVLTYQCTQLHLPELQGGALFVSDLPNDYSHSGDEGGPGATDATASAAEQAEAETQVAAAFSSFLEAIGASDRAALAAHHDPDFRGSDLEGRLLGVDDSVAAATALESPAIALSDLQVRRYGELALAWGRQELGQGDAAGEATAFSFLYVWRLGAEGWRILRYQLTPLETTLGAAAQSTRR